MPLDRPRVTILRAPLRFPLRPSAENRLPNAHDGSPRSGVKTRACRYQVGAWRRGEIRRFSAASLRLLVVALLVPGFGACGSSEKPSDSDAKQPDAAGEGAVSNTEQAAADPTLPADMPTNPEDLLRRVATAYQQATSYADAGHAHMVAVIDGVKNEERVNFSVTLRRPNRLRIEVTGAKIVCDGERFRAAIEDLPGQVLSRPAPERLSLAALEYDPVLVAKLAGPPFGAPPQLTWLLAEDPVSMVLAQAEGATLIEPDKIGDRTYARVQVKVPQGNVVFWIDPQTYALRRLEFPTDVMRQSLAGQGTVEAVSMVADFEGARLDEPVDPVAFQFEVPRDAREVGFFVTPHPAHLLGRKAPTFSFVDLQGKPVTADSLAGKVVVLQFWNSGWKPSLTSLGALGQLHAQWKDNRDVVWLAVSIDPPEVTGNTLVEAVQQTGASLPVVRDPQQQWQTLFHAGGTLPLLFVIDRNGVVQDVQVGNNPPPEERMQDLSVKLPKVLADKDVYEEALAAYRQQLERYQQELDRGAQARVEGAATMEIPRAQIAPRSDPKRLRLTPLWKCAELRSPGNVVVTQAPDGASRLLVIEGWRTVAEVGLDGKVIAQHELDIEKSEAVSKIRTAVDRSGRRFLAAFAVSDQRVHLLDASFQKLVSFPESALENPHQGISDVQLTDLDADGTLETCVGYWEIVGVQGVSLEGKRIWSNRRIAEVGCLTTGPPDDRGRRHLYCTHQNGSLAEIDPKGELVGEVALRNRALHWVVAADLTGDGQPEWCALSATPEHRNIAVGLDLSGRELWSYPLPLGVHERQIEEIVPGRLFPGAAGQWILPGGDGSIHVLAPDGKRVDQFNYGARLTGLATAEQDGRGLLIVATEKSLEAWRVE
jgi:peroxiredoxin